MPNWLLCQPDVSHGAKLIYSRLTQYAEVEGYAEPKQEALALEVGCELRQLRRYLSELAGHKLIEVQQPGGQRPNRYYFLTHDWMAAPLPTRGTDMVTTKEKTINLDEEFNVDFYPLYPRKVNPRGALKSYKQARKRAEIDEILRGLGEYIRMIDHKQTEKRFIQHPSTWLNQDGWQSDYQSEINDDRQASTPEQERTNGRLRLIAAANKLLQ